MAWNNLKNVQTVKQVLKTNNKNYRFHLKYKNNFVNCIRNSALMP